MLESFNKERRTDAATRRVNDTEVSSKNAVAYINAALTIVQEW